MSFTPAPVRFPITQEGSPLLTDGASFLVELRGIEPLSESISAELSPGAGGYGAVTRDSLSRGKPSRRPGQVASLCMVRSKLCARTDAADRRPDPGPQRSRAGRACLKRRPERNYRSQLILKVPAFMDVRGIRPLIPPPRPRRNHCSPMGVKNEICICQTNGADQSCEATTGNPRAEEHTHGM